jgi:hypothetical protein
MGQALTLVLPSMFAAIAVPMLLLVDGDVTLAERAEFWRHWRRCCGRCAGAVI